MLLTRGLVILCELQRAYDTWCETAADRQKYRRRAVIIANTNFHTSAGLSVRHGTEVDVRQLESVFTSLNFEVDVHKDQTSDVRYTHLLIVYLLSSSLLLLAYTLYIYKSLFVDFCPLFGYRS